MLSEKDLKRIKKVYKVSLFSPIFYTIVYALSIVMTSLGYGGEELTKSKFIIGVIVIVVFIILLWWYYFYSKRKNRKEWNKFIYFYNKLIFFSQTDKNIIINKNFNYSLRNVENLKELINLNKIKIDEKTNKISI